MQKLNPLHATGSSEYPKQRDQKLGYCCDDDADDENVRSQWTLGSAESALPWKVKHDVSQAQTQPQFQLGWALGVTGQKAPALIRSAMT